MKYHAILVIFEKKKQQNMKLSSAANYRCALRVNRVNGQNDGKKTCLTFIITKNRMLSYKARTF